MKNIFLVLFFAAVLFGAFRYFYPTDQSSGISANSAGKTEKGLPQGAYVYREKKTTPMIGEYSWSCTVYLPVEKYSQETLESIFRWFAARYPDENRAIDLNIYTNFEVMEYQVNQPIAAGLSSHAHEYLGAWYMRERLRNGTNEVIEYYNYSPDNNVKHYENSYGINLRGCRDFLPEAVKKWNREQGKIKLQIECIISTSNPSRYYYQLYCDKLGEGTAVFSMYNPSAEINPEKNVYFLGNGKVCFYFGWKFAVSMDAGATWNVWSADRKLKDFQAGEYNLIKSVAMEKNGTGKMELSRKDETVGAIKTLFTKDYGQHWEAE